MSYGWNNHFDDNRRGNFRGNFDDEPFRGFSRNDNMNFDLGRQRSPIFNERNHFNSQMPSNFSSFPSRNSNFGYEPQQHPQQQQQPTQSDSKVYHVPIHIEKDDNQSEPTKNSQQNKFQNNDRSNDAFDQQSFFNREHQPTKNYPGSSIRNMAAEEFKRQESELKRREDLRQNANLRKKANDSSGSEYRIPIRIEGNDSNDSNLVRDFNNMHAPFVCRENKPGQKQSTNQNDKFMDDNFADDSSFNQQPQQSQNYNQQNQAYSNQQRPQQSQPQQQEAKKPLDPMTIIQNILEEVEKYEHEIEYFTGEYQDKQYRYLDEYLTRSMLKLDSIDTNGDPNLKQSRKNALNYINRVIAKLEKIEKVHNEQKEENVETKAVEQSESDKNDDSKQAEPKNDLEENTSEEAKSDKKSNDKKNKSKDQEKGEEKKSEEKKKKSTKPDNKEKKKIKKDDN